uniref:Uncharacterized protein n=1 Tax=Clastoptera arizonana TaxID=38151 RepID=A0A1B6C6W7_9HEMI
MLKPIQNLSIFIYHKNVYINLSKWHKLFSSVYRSTTIDDFTENLVLEKGLKWDKLIKKSDENKKKLGQSHNETVNKLNLLCNDKSNRKETIIQNINECVKINNIPQLLLYLEICEKQNYCPAKENLLSLAKYLTINKNKHGLIMLKKLCEVNYPIEYKVQSHYNYLLADILWAEGNIKESLNLFGNVFCDNVVLRKQIKIMLCHKFSEVIKSHGEASRILLTHFDFVKMIVDSHNDYSLMAYFWKVLFESELYSDQQLAITLLKNYKELKSVIVWMIPHMGRQLLFEYKLETFYKLIEVLLCYDMKENCCCLLRMLFDFMYNNNDLKGCRSVAKACRDLEMPLSDRQEKNFLHLLLKTQPVIEKSKQLEYKF